MSKALKSTAMIAAGVAILGGVAAGAANQAAAYGPVDRETYTWQDINSDYFKGTWPKNKIVFNSITNTPNFGDERNFVGAREYNGDDNGFDNKWNGTSIKVKDGQEYKLRLFVHNNSPWGREGVATNVRTSFSIPNVSSKSVKVSGFIYADNAETVWDSVTFTSDKAFHLDYVYGSAVLGNKGIGNPENGKTNGNPLGYTLSDDVVDKSGGTLIGYDAIDGNIPGCYGYASYVTIRVKAVYDTDFEIEKEVRLAGDKEWSDNVEAKVGDKVEFLLTYKNTSNEVQRNVMLQDILPKNMRYVPNTTLIYNGKYNGGLMTDDSITTTGVNIGNYGPGVTVYVQFTAEIVDNTLQCGGNILANWAQGTVNNKGIQDYATVTLAKVCTEEEIPKTGPEALAGGAIAAGSIVTAAGYFIASRRSLR